MSKLVRTGKKIYDDIYDEILTYPVKTLPELKQKEKQKYLILPSGLDKLEEMLKEEMENCKEEILDFHLEDDKHIFSDLVEYMTYRAGNINLIVDKHFSSVFARFKKENRI